MRPLLVALLAALAASPLQAQGKLPPSARRTYHDPVTYAPALRPPYVTATSELRDLVARYLSDRGDVQRLYAAGSSDRSTKLRAFYHTWLASLPTIDFDHLSHEGQVDYVLLRNRIEYDVLLLGREERMRGANAPPPVPDTGPVTGTPVGRQTLIEDLKNEMIAYTPEQFLEIGKREYEWTENEMKKTARQMGFGDDWHAALEKAKNDYVARGEQPELVRNLQIQGESFVAGHGFITIPNQAHDAWRMTMMTPQQMRTAPFFLGGEGIQVSYPVEGMTDSLAVMIMKGNGPHLSHATVFHEMIPGHELQGFMARRYNSHRDTFGSPFYGEGWALYWEMQLWDAGFDMTPEDRMGALFWRMHRAARILFTLNFHLGNWTAQQCVDFLIANGHERWTAESEVRGHMRLAPRTPLYQAGYLMGALQLRSIYKEVVLDKKLMTTRQFNDAVMHEGAMPMEMLRNALENLPLTRDYTARWKYYGDVPGSMTLPDRPTTPPPATDLPSVFPPDLHDFVSSTSELRDIVNRYDADRTLLMRFYAVTGTTERAAKLRAFYAGWKNQLAALPVASLSREGRADARLLSTRIDHEVALLDREAAQRTAMAPLLPFADDIASLQDERQRLNFITTDGAAAAMRTLLPRITAARARVDAAPTRTAPALALNAAKQLDVLRGTLSAWYNFFYGYDPAFTAKVPPLYAPVDSALVAYALDLRTNVAGLSREVAMSLAETQSGGRGQRGGGGGGRGGRGGRANFAAEPAPSIGGPILGEPIGRAAVIEELRSERITDTPEQLLTLGANEIASASTASTNAGGKRAVTMPPLAAALGDDFTQLAGFIHQRYNSHRDLFESPVSRDGLLAYWNDSPETRRQNGARLLAAVNFHLGKWTAAQGMDSLVARGGFARPAAEAEMRRIAGSGSVLTGAGAAIGSSQLRALYADVVTTKHTKSEQAFHDALLREGPVPVATLRDLLAP